MAGPVASSGVPMDSSSPGPRSLAPREHGAYGQLGLPMLAALGSGLPGAVAALLSVSAWTLFLAHEPLLVLLGRRGERLQVEQRPRAMVRLVRQEQGPGAHREESGDHPVDPTRARRAWAIRAVRTHRAPSGRASVDPGEEESIGTPEDATGPAMRWRSSAGTPPAHRHPSRAFRWSPTRSTLAMMVSAGFTASARGKEASRRPRRDYPSREPAVSSRADVLGSRPKRCYRSGVQRRRGGCGTDEQVAARTAPGGMRGRAPERLPLHQLLERLAGRLCPFRLFGDR